MVVETGSQSLKSLVLRLQQMLAQRCATAPGVVGAAGQSGSAQ
jgi:hypothetical protein